MKNNHFLLTLILAILCATNNAFAASSSNENTPNQNPKRGTNSLKNKISQLYANEIIKKNPDEQLIKELKGMPNILKNEIAEEYVWLLIEKKPEIVNNNTKPIEFPDSLKNCFIGTSFDKILKRNAENIRNKKDTIGYTIKDNVLTLDPRILHGLNNIESFAKSKKVRHLKFGPLKFNCLLEELDDHHKAFIAVLQDNVAELKKYNEDNTQFDSLMINHPKVFLLGENNKEINLLEWAIMFGKANSIKYLLGKEKINPNLALECAIEIKDEGALKLLLSHQSANPNHPVYLNYGYRSKIIHQAINSTPNILETLLNHAKTDPNSCDSRGSTALHDTASNGNAAMVKLLLAHPKTNPNVRDKKGLTPLHHAVLNKLPHIVELLLGHPNIDPNVRDKEDMRTPLHYAALNFSYKMIKQLLNHKKILWYLSDKDGETAFDFLYALSSFQQLFLNHPKINPGELLCYSKAIYRPGFLESILSNPRTDPNCVSCCWPKQTGLIRAILQKRIDIVKMLLNDKRTDINKQSASYIETALQAAANCGHLDIAKLLLKNEKIDINLHVDKTALHIALKQKHINIAKLLLKNKKINVDSQNKYGETALHIASASGYQEIVELILKRSKESINAKDATGRTALHDVKNINIAKLLLKASKINPNIQDKDGKTALHSAIETMNYQREMVAKFLASHPKTDVNLQDNNGETALHLAEQWNNLTVAGELLKRSEINTKLKNKQGKVALNSFQMELIASRANDHSTNSNSSSSSSSSTNTTNNSDCNSSDSESESDEIEDIKTIKNLLKLNKINVNRKDKDGRTILHQAVEYEKPDTVKLLLNHKNTNPNIQGNHKETALHYAVDNNNSDIIKLLLSHKKIDTNIQASDGNTALHLAAQDNNSSAIRLLLNHAKTDPNIENKGGKTALHYAKQRNNKEIIKLLEEFSLKSNPSSSPSNNAVANNNNLPTNNSDAASESDELSENSDNASSDLNTNGGIASFWQKHKSTIIGGSILTTAAVGITAAVYWWWNKK